MAALQKTIKNLKLGQLSCRFFISTVIIAIIANFCLSGVSALRCHQCNSHLDPDCISLRLNTPRSPPDEQYLRECDDKNAVAAFCRKTVTKVEITGEHRITRGCGWIPASSYKSGNNSCFDADNEGFKQEICTCSTDGCNAAPPRIGKQSILDVLTFSGIALVIAHFLRRSG